MKNDKWLNDKFIVGLSPLDGITDEPFRLTQVSVAKPDVIFTEFVSAEGLAHGAVKLFDHLLYKPVERPIVAQLFGKDPEAFKIAANILCKLGFDGIDINFGCPERTVFGNGSGAAIIGNTDLAEKIITAVKTGVETEKLIKKPKVQNVIDKNNQYSSYVQTNKHPPTVSVKTRLGINKFTPQWLEFLDQQGLDFITLHGRTRKAGFSGKCHWNYINAVARTLKTPLFGNGDIQTRQQGIEYCQKYGLKGVLIGRAAMGNPWCFASTVPKPSEKFKTAVFHAKKFIEVFPDRRLDPLRRHFLLYASGLPHAKALRTQLVSLTTIDQLWSLEPEFRP